MRRAVGRGQMLGVCALPASPIFPLCINFDTPTDPVTNHPHRSRFNLYGRLGLGNEVNRGDAPHEMGNELPFVNLGTAQIVSDLVAGDHHTCVIVTGRVKCWGCVLSPLSVHLSRCNHQTLTTHHELTIIATGSATTRIPGATLKVSWDSGTGEIAAMPPTKWATLSPS